MLYHSKLKLWNSGQNSLTDKSGAGNNGTATTETYVAGKVGNAISLPNAANNIVSHGTNSAIGFYGSTPCTITFWVYFTTLLTGGMISRDSSSTGRNFVVRATSAGAVGIYTFAANGAYRGSATATGQVTTATWYHIALTWDGVINSNGFQIFINGVSKSLTNDNSATQDTVGMTATATRLGMYYDSTVQINGRMQDVQFYSGKVLTTNDIKRIYLGLHPIES